MENRSTFDLDPYHPPAFCSKCGGVMIFKGVGEYHCEDCKNVEYDDFGKVRLYIEQHKGATVTEVEAGTGVHNKTIRLMLKENRLEVAANSNVFLRCEICGKNIRAGHLCEACEKNYHERTEAMNRKEKKLRGFSAAVRESNDGAMRFTREE